MPQRNLEILNRFSVLYLEDEERLLKQTAMVLEDFVGKIYPCKSCAQAKEIFLQNKIDIIISDILLCNETGTGFLKELKDDGYETPAILTTAYTDTEYLMEAIHLKVEDYIIKPVNIKELLNSIYDVLLPRIQNTSMTKSRQIIQAVAAVTDSKAVDMIKFIVYNLDDENVFNHPYADIMSNIDVSKPTVIKLFKQLIDLGILEKLKNGKYKFHTQQLKNIEI